MAGVYVMVFEIIPFEQSKADDLHHLTNNSNLNLLRQMGVAFIASSVHRIQMLKPLTTTGYMEYYNYRKIDDLMLSAHMQLLINTR